MTSDKLHLTFDQPAAVVTTSAEQTFRFRKFPVYKNSRVFVRFVKDISQKKFPTHERFALLSQLWRALDSIILNIAEGSDRGTDKDFAHFLNLSYTSLNETVACSDVALDNGYITQLEHADILTKAALLKNELTAFRRSLLKSPTK